MQMSKFIHEHILLKYKESIWWSASPALSLCFGCNQCSQRCCASLVKTFLMPRQHTLNRRQHCAIESWHLASCPTQLASVLRLLYVSVYLQSGSEESVMCLWTRLSCKHTGWLFVCVFMKELGLMSRHLRARVCWMSPDLAHESMIAHALRSITCWSASASYVDPNILGFMVTQVWCLGKCRLEICRA